MGQIGSLTLESLLGKKGPATPMVAADGDAKNRPRGCDLCKSRMLINIRRTSRSPRFENVGKDFSDRHSDNNLTPVDPNGSSSHLYCDDL
jgi:hypothetical protein